MAEAELTTRPDDTSGIPTRRGRLERQLNAWSIILAGGDGDRLQPFVRRWLGETRPKQYCTFLGTRSLLQHTIDRADAITSSTHRVVVAARHHQPYLRAQMRGREGGREILQPRNRGTAPGIFLPLTYVLASDPHAMVTIFPSDHFVHPENAFIEAVSGARAASLELGGRPVVLGVAPDHREGDYGWIHRGTEIADHNLSAGPTLWNVDRFMEKPCRAALEDIHGAFWNTLVMTGSAQWLWRLGWRHVPQIMPLFARLRGCVGTNEEHGVLEQIYDVMPERDFSTDILQHGARSLALMSLEGVYWSDWGRQERVVDTLTRMGAGSVLSEKRPIERTSRVGTHEVHDLTPEPVLSPSVSCDD